MLFTLLWACRAPDADATAETGDPCVLRSPMEGTTLGPECDPWLAPDGIVSEEPIALLAGTRVVFASGTMVDLYALQAMGSAEEPVILEAEEDARFQGVLIRGQATLSHLVIRGTTDEAALRSLGWVDQPSGQKELTSLILDGLVIEDADTAVGLWADGIVDARSPVRFAAVTGPLASTTGRDLHRPLVEDAGSNAKPWIEVRPGRLPDAVPLTWAPQGVDLRLQQSLSLIGRPFEVVGNHVVMPPDGSIEIEGTAFRAQDTTFDADGQPWRGFVSRGPLHGAPVFELERVTVRDATGPVVDFRELAAGTVLSLRDTVLGPVEGGDDVCIASAECTDAGDPTYGNTLDCAVPVDQPAGCP
ncbi:MAG: hypothetical protein H6735_31105 [Alphaproteobacteria bacterium]|nr:hypothetical protein [Alphaproteobacteria bacterium]